MCDSYEVYSFQSLKYSYYNFQKNAVSVCFYLYILFVDPISPHINTGFQRCIYDFLMVFLWSNYDFLMVYV